MWNPTEAARLVAEMRDDVANFPRGRLRDWYAAISDQLEAAILEVARLTKTGQESAALHLACMRERDQLAETCRSQRVQIDALETRQQELLALTVRLTNETPFPEEANGWIETRAKMMAEIGSLRARLAELGGGL